MNRVEIKKKKKRKKEEGNNNRKPLLALRLSAAELELIDWLVVRGGFPSRSEAIRAAVLRECADRGVQRGGLEEVREQWRDHGPRRRKALASADQIDVGGVEGQEGGGRQRA